MRILEVNNKRTNTQFLNIVEKVYKDDPCYVRPLDIEIEGIFNPEINPFFKHGKAVRYILIDDAEDVIGRVAVFINEKKAYGYDQPTGGMGFFECLDNKDAAFKLFDKAVSWLKENGMEAMDGPINFGENDSYWGLLIEGFTDAAYGMQYNPVYYRSFFEEYGFQNYFEQITHRLDLKKPFPERFWKIAEWIGKKPEYNFKHFNWKEKDKFMKDLVEVYNDAWRFHENFTPLTIERVAPAFEKAKSIAVEEFLWFAYYKNEPIGFIILFPDVNQILKKFNGKLNLINKLRFLWHKKRNSIKRLRVVILGVKTKYQKSGVESGLFYHLREPVFKRPWIEEMELSWVGDFNPKMRALQDAMGAEFSKKHITYRFVFDPEKRTAHRAASIPKDTKERQVDIIKEK